MVKDVLLRAYNFNLKYAEQLLEDVPEELMTTSPALGLENHPAFTIGHLITAAALTSKYLDGPYQLPVGWEELFRRRGPGDPRLPDSDVDKYPTKVELLSELKRQHEIVAKLIIEIDENRFQEITKWRFSEHMPTLGELIYFMCISHDCMHLSQLAAWCRAVSLPSALGRL